MSRFHRIKAALSPTDRITGGFLRRHGLSGAPGRWIDIGAGSAPFAHFAPDWQYVAIDLDRRPTTSLIADGQALPLADGCADLCTLLESLQYMPDPDLALTEARRLLRPGGRLVLRYPFLYPEGPDHSLHRWTAEGMRQLLQRNGFIVREETRLGGPFLLICLEIGEFALRLCPGWRRLGQGQGWRRRSRAIITNALMLPWLLLGHGALLLDRCLVRNPAHYQGGVMLAERNDDD